MDEFFELTEAMQGFELSPTGVDVRQRLEAAIERYLSALRVLVGDDLTARYSRAFAGFIAALEREAKLNAYFSRLGGTLEDADLALLNKLRADEADARLALEAMAAEVTRVLDKEGTDRR